MKFYFVGSCVIFLCCLLGVLVAQEELTTTEFAATTTNTSDGLFNETATTTTTEPAREYTYLTTCYPMNNQCPYHYYEFCNPDTFRCECSPGAKYNWTLSECQPCPRMDYFTCFDCCPWSGYTCNFGRCEKISLPTYPPYPDPLPPQNQPYRLSTPMVIFLSVLLLAATVALALWRRFCRNLTKSSNANRIDVSQLPPPYVPNLGSTDTTATTTNIDNRTAAASSGPQIVAPSAPDTVVIFSENSRPAMRMPAESRKPHPMLDDLPPSYMEAIVSSQRSVKDRTT